MSAKQDIIDEWIEKFDIDIEDAYAMYDDLYGDDYDDAQDY
jgi:hypothetical protein